MQEFYAQALHLLNAVWHRRWAALGATWLVALLGWSLVVAQPNTYTSSARIFIDATSIMKPLLEGLAIDWDINLDPEVMKQTLTTRANLERVARMADLDLMATTPAEMELLPSATPKTVIIPNGVDSDYFTPEAGHPCPFGQGGPVVVFTGDMSYWPNQDAVIWFAREVLSGLRTNHPGLRFVVVGRAPPRRLRRFAARRDIDRRKSLRSNPALPTGRSPTASAIEPIHGRTADLRTQAAGGARRQGLPRPRGPASPSNRESLRAVRWAPGHPTPDLTSPNRHISLDELPLSKTSGNSCSELRAATAQQRFAPAHEFCRSPRFHCTSTTNPQVRPVEAPSSRMASIGGEQDNGDTDSLPLRALE